MLYREIIAVCSQIHTKHKYTVWAERRIVGCQTDFTQSSQGGLKESYVLKAYPVCPLKCYALQMCIYRYL